MNIREPWTPESRALWQRIAAHPFADPAQPLDFTAKLAREHGWTREFAARAIDEYRRFCFLACAAGREVTPSGAIDEVWHLHLTHSRDYWESFCRDTLRTPLHHEPSRGSRADDARHREQYAETLAAYEAFFGAPPAALWPSTHEQFRRPQRFRRVDLERAIVLPRPRLGALRARVAAFLAAALLVAPVALAQEANPLDWTGPDFLKLYLGMLIIAIGAGWFWRRQLRSGPARNAGNLGTYEIAYLNGGATRVVDAGVAELLATNKASWDGSGRRVAVLSNPRSLAAPLDQIAEQVQKTGTPSAAAKGIEAALAPIRKSLVSRGLLLDDASASRARLVSALLPAIVVGFGLVKIAIGASRGKPVAFLVVLTMVALVVTLVFAFKKIDRTRAGDAAIAALKDKHARAARAPKGNEIPLAVALVGTSVLAGTAYAGYHDYRQPQGDSGSSSSDGSSSSGDSGGGDSGGGGGCGGCGGGGGD